MSNSLVFVVTGTVVENLPNTMFRVRITDGSRPEMTEKVILCHLAGKMRMHYVKLLPGDNVRCEINPLDVTKGRIVFKIK
jgi:translation initiation factor IF-1